MDADYDDLVLRSQLWGWRVPGSKPDSTEDPLCKESNSKRCVPIETPLLPAQGQIDVILLACTEIATSTHAYGESD
ncbi:hypothetical protein AVEN_57976-1 [Araneus ventricosus]|uniref:Uncharacterized protein n=1 Tax=Araneus ventricosus TaxID=182803 RepID=A0A4Y2U1H7_ARAVE|nr:hypothetical protein AVEN_57976-1 [Araneus ventricosus]